MVDKSTVDMLYISGLLHDLGKYVRKYNNCGIKHQTLSQLLILAFPKLCLGHDSDRLASIIAHHHPERDTLSKNVLIAPHIQINDMLASLSDENYTKYENDEFIKILKIADSLSASSDRASETEGNNGSSSPYAPLISVIGKLNNRRIAIKHSTDYSAYEWTGDTDTSETVAQNDENFKNAITESYEDFINSINRLTDVASLNKLLKKHFRTVNANTWRPQGESLCNTTTSLYDHSKTTAMITVCLYMNEQYGLKCNINNPHIDIIRMTYNGFNNTMSNITAEALDRFNLETINIISSTPKETYIMLPQSITDDFLSHIETINGQMYQKFGETIDCEIAKDWQFKNCRDDFNSRFCIKKQGIIDVITRFSASDINTSPIYKCCDELSKERYVAGFTVNNYEPMLDKLLSENDSISKFATYLRTYEDFMEEVHALLSTFKNVTIIMSDFDKCIYETDKPQIHTIEKKIYELYCKYVSNSTGLSFSYVEVNRYRDSINELTSSLSIMQSKVKPIGEEDSTYISINGKRFTIEGLNNYYRYLSDIKTIDNNSILYKITELYQLAFKYKKDKDTSPLIALSRLSYIATKAKTEAERKIIETAIRFLFTRNNETKQIERINSNAYILYEAMYDAVRL